MAKAHRNKIMGHLPIPHVSILRTCRLIYAEALPVLYSNVLFKAKVLEAWVLFSKVIGARNLSLVTHLRGTWSSLLPSWRYWTGEPPVYVGKHTTFESDCNNQFWDIVAEKMPSLRYLLIIIDYPNGALSRSTDASWHLPMHKVKGLVGFDMVFVDAIGASQETAVLVDFLRKKICA